MFRVLLVTALLLACIPAQVVSAETPPGNYLTDQAGMAAYFAFTGPTILNSNLLKNLFRSCQVSENYLIGFWPVPGYEDDNRQDVRVLVHNAGWVVAYYDNQRPVSNILDFDGAPHTRLSLALEKIAWAIEVTAPVIHYTNFHYPQAEHLLRIGRLRPTYAGVNSFEVRLPATNTYYERAWYLRTTSSMNTGKIYLDGRQMAAVKWAGAGIIPEWDMVTMARHIIDIENTMTFWGNVWGELVILYSGNDLFTIDYADTIQTIDLAPAPIELLTAAADLPRFFEFYLPAVVR